MKFKLVNVNDSGDVTFDCIPEKDDELKVPDWILKYSRTFTIKINSINFRIAGRGLPTDYSSSIGINPNRYSEKINIIDDEYLCAHRSAENISIMIKEIDNFIDRNVFININNFDDYGRFIRNRISEELYNFYKRYKGVFDYMSNLYTLEGLLEKSFSYANIDIEIEKALVNKIDIIIEKYKKAINTNIERNKHYEN